MKTWIQNSVKATHTVFEGSKPTAGAFKISRYLKAVEAIARRFVKEYKGVQQRTTEETDLEERKDTDIHYRWCKEEIQNIRSQSRNSLHKHNRLKQSDDLWVGGRSLISLTS